MKLIDLVPGDVVSDETSGLRMAFVSLVIPHPLYGGLSLVVWRRVSTVSLPCDVEDGKDGIPKWVMGEWHHDALAEDMRMPDNLWVRPITDRGRREVLAQVFHG